MKIRKGLFEANGKVREENIAVGSESLKRCRLCAGARWLSNMDEKGELPYFAWDPVGDNEDPTMHIRPCPVCNIAGKKFATDTWRCPTPMR